MPSAYVHDGSYVYCMRRSQAKFPFNIRLSYGKIFGAGVIYPLTIRILSSAPSRPGNVF